MPASAGIPNTRASQLDYRQRNVAGRNGALADLYRHDLISAGAEANGLANIVTVTVGAAEERTYSLDVLGTTVEFEASDSDTIATIAEGLSDAVNEEPLINQRVTATFTATTVVLTGSFVGVDLEVDDSDADLTAAQTQEQSLGEPTPFGRVVVLTPTNQGEYPEGPYITHTARLVQTGDTLADLKLGITIARHDTEVDSEGRGAYQPREIMEVGRNANVFIEGLGNATPASILVGTAEGERGQIFVTAGTGRVALPGAAWGGSRDHGIAIIEFRGN